MNSSKISEIGHREQALVVFLHYFLGALFKGVHMGVMKSAGFYADNGFNCESSLLRDGRTFVRVIPVGWPENSVLELYYDPGETMPYKGGFYHLALLAGIRFKFSTGAFEPPLLDFNESSKEEFLEIRCKIKKFARAELSRLRHAEREKATPRASSDPATATASCK